MASRPFSATHRTPLRRISCGGWWRWRTSCDFLYGKAHTRTFPVLRGRKSVCAQPENPKKDPLNRRSLGCARDDKGEVALPWRARLLNKPFFITLGGPRAHHTLPAGNRAPWKASTLPLSSRAQPRDLRFSGPFLGMFLDAAYLSRSASRWSATRMALAMIVSDGLTALAETKQEASTKSPARMRNIAAP